MSVVYFDQQTHAWASVCMVENDKKCLKIIKNYFGIMGMRGSSSLVCCIFRQRLSAAHSKRWSKYTTLVFPVRMWCLLPFRIHENVRPKDPYPSPPT